MASLLSRLLRVAAAASLGMAANATVAAPSTQRGQISVSQVRDMLEQARTNPTARQVLTAYLAGVGETAGTMIDAAGQNAAQFLACKGRLSLDDTAARHALERAAPNANVWAETAATPLILRDMLKRANCRVPE